MAAGAAGEVPAIVRTAKASAAGAGEVQPLVHVALGALLGYGAGVAIGAAPSRHRAAVVASACWASLPDWHLALSAAGIDGLARSWRAYHDAPVANLHWFHHAIDARETTLYALEDAVALAVLAAIAVVLSRRHSASARERSSDD